MKEKELGLEKNNMKAFEKWWNWWGKCPEDGVQSNPRKFLSREGYRVALQHIQCKIKKEKNHTDSVDVQNAYDTIINYIEEELEQ